MSYPVGPDPLGWNTVVWMSLPRPRAIPARSSMGSGAVKDGVGRQAYDGGVDIAGAIATATLLSAGTRHRTTGELRGWSS